MRYVAEYRDPNRPGRGSRRFLYVEAFDQAKVWEHAQQHPPAEGWELHEVRPARSDVDYREVPRG